MIYSYVKRKLLHLLRLEHIEESIICHPYLSDVWSPFLCIIKPQIKCALEVKIMVRTHMKNMTAIRVPLTRHNLTVKELNPERASKQVIMERDEAR